ncbi:hypothetical protein [Vulcanisaeta souniana]|uniref:Uncharacterized protein n=1 Tax=Vulcanisaeta souniana JCM 11219 TaxID=1293586 RepID=A0A830DZR2_9CREN|nr:hypothetical protein [Vulcanisaeta souniana]BDR92030.1 hypothetical protein Vsou_11230 [Vulcanisaeta souniana JCM 11219]GGI68450.1 hypothetical protein GCM10007112_01820 [Vulcanisaeta souniana JCM 11219]
MMNRYGTFPSALLLGVILTLVMIAAVTHAEAGVTTNQVNNAIVEALERCGVNPYTVSVTEITPIVQNGSITIEAALSNNYNLKIVMNLTNKLIPVSDINIAVTHNSEICNSTIQIPNPPGNYSNTVLEANHFIEVISYTGSSPMTTSSMNTLVVYGTSIDSVIVIPNMTAYTGNIVCNTGSPTTPIYIVGLNKPMPIMYIIQPSRPITSLLCRYSQTMGGSYLLMALLIGITAALIYESILVIIKVYHPTHP